MITWIPTYAASILQAKKPMNTAATKHHPIKTQAEPYQSEPLLYSKKPGSMRERAAEDS